ncbi:hypothetical protein [Flavobacterium sp. W22_SRS_FP1]|uniref:hypothetical protein n=1 Tax=Flavobacterium sp. W22_SRS_FP1 TaxID=3240276 RepID=UPI003F914C9E
MKKSLLLFFFLLLIISCGVKKTQNLLSEGDYDAAINRAVEGLRSNKSSKGKQEYVYLLEEAFAKAKERDLRNLDLLAKDKNPRNFEAIYNTYIHLNNRQDKIRPILPLPLLNKGRNAYFSFDNYNSQIVTSKNSLSKYLYDNSKALMLTDDKQTFRRVYDDLNYLNQINPNYKDVIKLMEEVQFKGTDFVSVSLNNETNMMLPIRLQNDLLDFDAFKMNDKWTAYHNQLQKGIDYDFQLIVNFRRIDVSPEQLKEKEIIIERKIKDGLKTLIDKNGKVVKDSLGNPKKIDDFKTIRVRIYEFNQFKSCQITAQVDYVNAKNNQLLESFALSSESVFENTYATYKGDKRASDDSYYSYFDKRGLPFPTNEQMVYNTAEDLKDKLKDIINRNKFRD